MEYNIDEINKLSLVDFLKLFDSLNEEELIDIVNSNVILNMNGNLFKTFFLKSSIEVKKCILENEILFDKVMSIKPNSNGKMLFELFDEKKINTILALFINSKYITKYEQLITNYLKKIDDETFFKLINELDFLQVFNEHSIFKNSNYLYNFLVNTMKYDINTSELFINRVKTGLNPLTLLRTTNEKELFLLAKFNLVIKVRDTNDNKITLSNGYSIDYDILKKLYTKHVYTLSNMLLRKGNTNHEEVFIATIQLYSIFGFDNAFKIINNTFTQMTESAINRVCEVSFKDLRREFRINNQNKFYYYGIEQGAIEAIAKMDINFFLPFTFENDIEEAFELMNLIKKHIKGMTPGESEEYIKEILINAINKREKCYKKINMNLTKERIKNKNPKNMITASDIVNILGDAIPTFNLDEKGINTPNPDIQSFLLGNLKKDNDCLFRLIINKEAFGLNDTISNVINNFTTIKEAVNKSNGKLSLNSILDIIDISKVNLYDMTPDLQDIMLSTLSKIIKSKKYRTKPEEIVVKETFNLHRERKHKVFSTIPSIKGTCENIKYRVAPFDADYLLAAGVDADNCLKVGALGEDLLRYCLLNKNGVIVYLYDSQNNVYVCPFIRSGNTIHCNGIDPKPEESLLEECLKALEQFAKEVCDTSTIEGREHYSNIEAVTITDLHIPNYMKNSKYEKFNLQEYLPIDAGIYTDYNKDTIENYFLYKSSSYTGSIYYVSNDEFYQTRNPIYKYNVLKEFDKERINIFVNNIAYSYIDYLPVDEDTKRSLKENYKNIDASSFRFIVGNKDWFIAIDNRLSLVTYILPYDERARTEYLESLNNVNEFIKKFTDEDIQSLRKRSR